MSLKDVFSSVKESFKFSKPVTIKGVKYGLGILSMGQERKVNAYLETINKDDTDEYLNELRKSIVSEAIISINEEILGKTVKVDEGGVEVEKDKAIAVKELLSELPSTIVEELFNTYIDVKEQAEDILKKEMKYDWFKTPEQRDKELEDKVKKEEELEKDIAKREAELPDIKLKKVTETESPEIPK